MTTVPSPNNVRVAFDEDLLRSFYIDGRMRLQDIAERLGVSPTTVRRRFNDLRIPTRPRGPMPEHVRRGLAPSPVWTTALAYTVGILATDGCLSKNRRTVAVTSKDIEIVQAVQAALGGGGIGLTANGRDQWFYRYQFPNRRMYRWLIEVGLTSAKSLTLGKLRVPDELFADFVRGCIDGDGSIVAYIDRYNAKKDPKYVYERLYVSLVSASPEFLRWIRQTVQRLTGLAGHLTVRRSMKHHDLWRLRYAKRESATLLTWLYYAPEIPALRRKRQRAVSALAGATWYRHLLSDTERFSRAASRAGVE